MRILLIDTVYPEFISWLYANEPDLAKQSYQRQLGRALEVCYHNVSVWADPLRRLGFEVHEIWSNHVPLQHTWCRENGRMDLVPEFSEQPLEVLNKELNKRKHWFIPVVIEQVKAIKPDILWLTNLYTFEDGFLGACEGYYRHAIGQNAAMPPETSLSRLDLTVSASAENNRYFRSRGLPSELLPHGFNTRILNYLDAAAREPVRDFGFFGSFYPAHSQRREAMLQIANALPIEVFTDAKLPKEFSATKMRKHAALWGLDMYREIERTGMVLNFHLDSTGDWATNQRLYEVTGVGSVLVTDWKANMPELFDIDRDVIVYRSIEECMEKVRYMMDHPDARSEMAARGRRRTLTEHTVFHRGLRIREILHKHGLV